jgi:hypothetical protein
MSNVHRPCTFPTTASADPPAMMWDRAHTRSTRGNGLQPPSNPPWTLPKSFGSGQRTATIHAGKRLRENWHWTQRTHCHWSSANLESSGPGRVLPVSLRPPGRSELPARITVSIMTNWKGPETEGAIIAKDVEDSRMP